MKSKKGINKYYRKDDQQGQKNVDDKWGDLFLYFDICKEDSQLSKDKSKHESQADQIEEKIFVVSFSNAASDPRTMMIKSLNAHIAVIAVCGSRRAKSEAGVAKFNFLGIGFHCYGIKDRFVLADGSVNILFTNRDIFVGGVFIRAKNFRNDSWISEGENSHKNITKDMKNNAEYDQIPIFTIRCEDIVQYHTSVKQDKSNEIFFRLRNDESIFMLILKIGNIGDIVSSVLLLNSIAFD